MSEIEFFDADSVATGAVGAPGARAFYLQARNADAQLTVLVEKEQIALLAKEAGAFLDRLSEEYPEDPIPVPLERAELREPTVPLFRARLIGLGFDPDRGLVLIELREHASSDLDDDEIDVEPEPDEPEPDEPQPDEPQPDEPQPDEPQPDEEEPGHVARIYATRAQVRALIEHGDVVVAAGRPPCSLCGMPMDPAGHRCPRWN